jgi:4-azaleucine resistance transporter AzlC
LQTDICKEEFQLGNCSERNKALKAAFPHTIPVLTGFFFLGTAYGILMSVKGYGVLWSFLMSAIAFCGSMQFVAITLLTTTFDPVQAFFLSLVVNARHLFYGISILDKYKGFGKIKNFLIYVLCDETFSIICSANPPEAVSPKWFYFFISLLNYCYWVTGTVVGGLLGNLAGFNTKGLDFVLTALFVVIFLNHWETPKNRFPATVGVMVSICCLMIFGKTNFIIPSLIVILAVSASRRAQNKMKIMAKSQEPTA